MLGGKERFGGKIFTIVGIVLLMVSFGTVSAHATVAPYGGVTYWPVSLRTAVSSAIAKNVSLAGGGHDFAVPDGTAVYAVRDGVVSVSADLIGYEPRLEGTGFAQNGYYSYGRYVKIVHPGTPDAMVYAHLSQRLVQAGQTVRAGQLVGYSGHNGYALGPHLHIDWNGAVGAVNWLATQPVYPSYPGGVDTRIQGGTSVEVQTGAAPGQMVFGNVTVTQPVGIGFTTAYPCSEGLPRDSYGNINASVNNFSANQTTPNFAMVKTDADGKICFYANVTTHLLWDQSGATGAVVAHNSVRKLDTRVSEPAGARVPAGAVKKIMVGKQYAGQTILGNLTVVNAGGSGFTTAYPCTEGLPRDSYGNVNASVNNFVNGETTPNFVAVRADVNGDICFYTSNLAHLLFDQTAETRAIVATKPVRILDTRTFGTRTRITGEVRLTVGTPGQTVFGNVTVTDPAGAGYTVAYPCTEGTPKNSFGAVNASVNNFVAGETTPNFVAVRADGNGEVCFYTSASTHLIFDQVGSSGSVSAGSPTRLLDTR